MSEQSNRNRWVCPNDRELTLRAKLSTGWSVKSHNFRTETQFTRSSQEEESQQISEQEQLMIADVLNRSQQVEQMEKNRINKLIERIKNMKRNANGDGQRCCALCNDVFRFFSNQHRICNDCSKCVCNKCGVDAISPENRQIYLCKICSETREMWKKSGAWFFNSLPTYCYNLAMALQKNQLVESFISSKPNEKKEAIPLETFKSLPRQRMHLDPLPTLSDHLCHEIITTPILTADQLPTGFFSSAFHINSHHQNQMPSLSISNQSMGSSFSLYTNGANSKNRHMIQSSSSERIYSTSRSSGWEQSKEPKSYQQDDSKQESRINSIEEQPELEAEATEQQSSVNSSVMIVFAADESEPQLQQSVLLRNEENRSHSPNRHRHGIRTVQDVVVSHRTFESQDDSSIHRHLH